MELIIGGQLPNDHIGRRVGKPDILARVEDTSIGGNAWSHVPADVTNHLTLQQSPQGSFGPAESSPLDPPTPAAAITSSEQWSRRHSDDVLQLTHYWRVLEAAGLRAARSPSFGDHRS